MDKMIPVEHVRWFYKTSSSDSSLEPFSDYDSIKVENEFRELCALSKNPDGKVDVRDGFFEVDFSSRTCTPIYWSSDKIPKTFRRRSWKSALVQRGLWFRTDNWQPLDEVDSDAIEDVYVTEILPLLDIAIGETSKIEVINSLNIRNRYYRFLRDGKVYLDTNITAHYFRKKYNIADGVLLSRGSNCIAKPCKKLPEITHLVFIVHGIGQTIGNITWDCIRMRETCSKLQEKYFSEHEGRLEFLPVEWRTNLRLNEETIRSVTISDCQPLRAYLNSTALDIMYYTSPMPRMEIMRAFYHEVVRLFGVFCQHNPTFIEKGGKVSIIAHSLGAVVAFDVLTSSTPMYADSAYIQMLQKINNESQDRCDLISQYTKLTEVERKVLFFARTNEEDDLKCSGGNSSNSEDELTKPHPIAFPKVEKLFCLGSPLGVFLALRGIQPIPAESQQNDRAQTSYDSDMTEVPHTRLKVPPTPLMNGNYKSKDESHLHNSNEKFRLFNIFHPRDPVAYRLEPLILSHYANVQPAIIGNPKMLKDPDLPKSPPTKPIEETFGFTDSQSNNKNKARLSRINNNPPSSVPKSLGLAMSALANYLKKSQPSGVATLFEKPPEITNLMPLPTERHLRARIDFQLEAEEPTMQNLLVHVFTSHGGYWTNEALCLFLLSQIFDEAPKFTSTIPRPLNSPT